MPAIEMTTAQVPRIYRRFALAIGSNHWQGAVARQEEAIRSNHFLRDYLRSEYAVAYKLDELRKSIQRCGVIPFETCNDPSIFPSMAFASQVLEVLSRSRAKQCKTFVKRVRAAFRSAENMHGLRLELLAATHFVRRGYCIDWHRVKNQGTFDLLIKDLGPVGLEVECKSISENKGRRIHRRDALEFWGEIWKDVAGIAQNLRTGLAVVLTVANRLPVDVAEKSRLAREVVVRILDGQSGTLGSGGDVRIQPFDSHLLAAVEGKGNKMWREAVDAATGTINREAAVYRTPAGGVLAFVMQSTVEDDVLNQVFATLDKSAADQFTRKRGALFWVELQGVDSDQLVSLHKQDNDPSQQPTALTKGVSDFLHRSPDHIVGVVFSSRSSRVPIVNGVGDSGGATHFFLKEESPFWHPSFREPLRTAV